MNRYSAINQIRHQLQSGKTSLGSWIQIPHPSIAEIMGQSGYDWVAVDMEHGSISHHQLPDLFRALELGNTLPLARISEGTPLACKQALDAGAGGVIVPMIESASQLLSIKDACQWPPAGKRGVGFSRANLFGKYFDSYQEEAQSPLLVAMIEHINALSKLDEILAVEGLDSILVGPYDLSASMKITADFNNPDFQSSIGEILRKSELYSIPVGIHIVQPSKAELKLRISQGYRFIAYSIDSVMLSHVSTLSKDEVLS